MKFDISYGRLNAVVFVSIALPFLIFSCRKNDPQINESGLPNTYCTTLPSEYDNHIGWITTQTELPRQIRPCFNPLNSDEIVFQEDSEEGESGVFKYNMLTKEKTLLAQGSLVSQPSWGVNDWILLVFYDFNVWRIKSDGTGLEQLTTEGGYYSPKWNSEGSHFMTYTPFKADVSYIHNTGGEVTDSIPFDVRHFYSTEISPYIISHHQNQYSLFDSTINTVVFDHQFQSEWGGSSSGSVLWRDENNLIYANSDGIFTSSYNYQQIARLVEGCNSVSYSHGDINQEKTQMIWAFSKKEYIGSGIVKVETVLQLMDVDGNIILNNVLE